MLRCIAVAYKSVPDNTNVCVSGVVYVIWARGRDRMANCERLSHVRDVVQGFLRFPPRDVVGQANRIERCDHVITGYPKLLGLRQLPRD
jgi:hypothetical protein